MSDVVNITAVPVVYLRSVATRKFPSSQWLINPDLSLLLDIVDQKFWKVVGGVGGTVEEMTQGEKDAVLAAEVQAQIDALKQLIQDRLSLGSSIQGVSSSVSTAGLVITVNVGPIIVDDETTIVADPSLTKTVKVLLVFNISSLLLTVEVFEKTDGLYDDFLSVERLAADFGEFTVGPAGTVLVPV